MTTTTFSVSTNTSTDAAFRAAGSAINTAILAVGIVQTSDTGQVNWTTITKPLTASTYAGYEMYRFNDSLQSTNPVYFKISYYTNGYSTGQGLNLYIQAGQGTDGAGTLTGNVSSNLPVSNNSSGETATRASYVSGSTNRLSMLLWPTTTMTNFWYVIGIERTHDSSGADTSAGVYLFTASYTSSGYSQYLPLGASTTLLPQAIGSGWYCSTPLSGSGTISGNTYTYPIKTYSMTESLPCFNFLHYLSADITTGTTVSITGYDGTSRNYYASGLINSGTYFAYSGANSTTCLLMRYE